MAMFADDLARLCEKLGLIKPVVICHSMGGTIVLELAAAIPGSCFNRSPRAPQHVLASAFANRIMQYDVTSATTGCRVPVAHIGDITTAISHSDLTRFQDLTPQEARLGYNHLREWK